MDLRPLRDQQYSEGGLNEHLRGKKHKAREASLAGNDSLQVHQEQTDSKNGGRPKTMKMEKTKASRMNSKFCCEMCQNGAPSKVAMACLKKGKKHTMHFKFWCEMCQIGTLSETVMVSHMSGKKDRVRLIELGQQFGEASLNFVPEPLIAPSVDYLVHTEDALFDTLCSIANIGS